MLMANNILKKDYPSVDGLQYTLLQQNFSWNIPSFEFVQVLHVNGNHWITIRNIGLSDCSVNVYDSVASIKQKKNSLQNMFTRTR